MLQWRKWNGIYWIKKAINFNQLLWSDLFNYSLLNKLLLL